MTDIGLLNGQPVGCELPPAVPCEVCGHPVWLTKRVTVEREDGGEMEWRDAVFELDFPKPGQAWTLTKHLCRPSGNGSSAHRRTG